MTQAQGEHWWHRLDADVQRWLQDNHGSTLSTEAFDAVVGAGGVPIRDPDSHPDELPDGYLLSDTDWEVIGEQRRPD